MLPDLKMNVAIYPLQRVSSLPSWHVQLSTHLAPASFLDVAQYEGPLCRVKQQSPVQNKILDF